jgi:iron complex outermembrane receptor protein
VTGSCTFTFANEKSWGDVSPRVGLQWRPQANTQVYGFWAKGFRSGGYNFRQTDITISPGPFDAEEQSSFEVGLKQDFADTARLNLALFHNTVDRIQREINTPGAQGVAQEIANVGDLEIYGAELEGQLYLSSALNLSVQAGYTHGEYKTLRRSLTGEIPPVIDAADYALQPPRLSPWTYGAAVSYELELGSLGSLASRVSFNHRDANFYTDNNRGRLNEFDDLGANVTYKVSDASPWSVTLYGSNLMNQTSFGADVQLPDTPLYGGDGALGPRPPPTFSPLNKGRVVGAEVRVTF